MVADYCFVEQKRELFREAALRGWLAATLDFPRIKTHEESLAAAQRLPDEMRS